MHNPELQRLQPSPEQYIPDGETPGKGYFWMSSLILHKFPGFSLRGLPATNNSTPNISP
jgi:hypothetical protein